MKKLSSFMTALAAAALLSVTFFACKTEGDEPSPQEEAAGVTIVSQLVKPYEETATAAAFSVKLTKIQVTTARAVDFEWQNAASSADFDENYLPPPPLRPRKPC